MKIKQIGVLTSGGDAPGMNAAIRAVVRSGLHQGLRVYGIKRGFAGLMDGEITEMTSSSVGDIIHRGGTILKTSRSPEFTTEAGLRQALNVIGVFKLDAIAVIGGDGSLHGALELSKHGVSVVGIPATIDNDLAYTDVTIGLSTAVNNVLDSINKIRDTSSAHERITIVEVMGRSSGDIALHAGLAGGAESIVVPELPYSIDDICMRLMKNKNYGKRYSIIVLAEGACRGETLAQEIKTRTDLDAKVCVLGYVQRGGNPTATDRILATRLGAEAVRRLLMGAYGKAIGLRGDVLVADPLEEALAMKKKFHQELYDLAGFLSNIIT